MILDLKILKKLLRDILLALFKPFQASVRISFRTFPVSVIFPVFFLSIRTHIYKLQDTTIIGLSISVADIPGKFSWSFWHDK